MKKSIVIAFALAAVLVPAALATAPAQNPARRYFRHHTTCRPGEHTPPGVRRNRRSDMPPTLRNGTDKTHDPTLFTCPIHRRLKPPFPSGRTDGPRGGQRLPARQVRRDRLHPRIRERPTDRLDDPGPDPPTDRACLRLPAPSRPPTARSSPRSTTGRTSIRNGAKPASFRDTESALRAT